MKLVKKELNVEPEPVTVEAFNAFPIKQEVPDPQSLKIFTTGSVAKDEPHEEFLKQALVKPEPLEDYEEFQPSTQRRKLDSSIFKLSFKTNF